MWSLIIFIKNISNFYEKISEKNHKVSNNTITKLKSLPQSFLINLGLHKRNDNLDKNEKLKKIYNEDNENYPNNIKFKVENYIETLKSEKSLRSV